MSPQDASCAAPVRVLLVDDEPDILEAYEATLGAKESSDEDALIEDLEARIFGGGGSTPDPSPAFETVPCRQAEEAVERVRDSVATDTPFAIAFVDVRMPPGRDGVWAAEAIRSLDPDLEIVMVTAYSDVEVPEIARRIPPADRLLFIQKPFYPHEVQQFAASLSAKWLARRDLARRNAELSRLNDRLSRELAESERLDAEKTRLAMAIEQAGDMILIMDPERRIIYVNPALEQGTGYARDEILGRTPELFRSDEYKDWYYEEIWKSVRAGTRWTGQIVRRRKDGTRYHEHTTIAPVVDADGAIVSYVAVMRDVSREIALEGRLRQTQRMEVLGRLAGGVAHDFNNLLTVVSGYCELLVDETEPESALALYAAEIKSNALRAATLTKQLLTFSRGQVTETDVLDLGQTYRSMETMAGRLVRKGVEISSRIGTDLALVRANASQMEQVILNLIVNASDAMPEGGTISVEIETCGPDRSRLDDERTSLMLAVTDTGCGMDEETRTHIFEPFFTTKGLGDGTGLGLSTVYGIVSKAGGQIHVESEPGRGTRFEVHLPLLDDARPDPTQEPATPETAETGIRTILLVDDEESVRKLARLSLDRLGYRVLEAAGGREAREISETHSGSIDLLLTDVNMPEMTGPELADELASSRPGMRVLFASGYSDDDALTEKSRLDDFLFIPKPFTPRSLASRLREIFGETHQEAERE